MQIDAPQFEQLLAALVPGRGGPHRKADGEPALTPAEAELVVAIARLAVAADAVDDPDEVALFDALAAQIYAAARVATTPSTLAPIADVDARLDLLETHAAQLRDTPVAKLAYGLAFAISVADVEIAPAESELLDVLAEALGLDEETAGEVTFTVSAIATPPA